MSAKDLIVKLIGDSKSLEDALKNSSKEADKFAGVTSKTRERVGMAGLALGGVLVAGLVDAGKAAIEGQISQQKLDTALRNTHQSVKAMTPALEAAQQAALNMGFSDDSARESLAKLETATGSTSASIKNLSVAQDLARFKHVSLTQATTILTGAMVGQQRAARSLGINVAPVTTHMEALKAKYAELGRAIPPVEAATAKLLDKQATGQAVIQAVTDKVHGQAKAYSDTAQGAATVFAVKIDDLKEKFGAALLPAITAVTGALVVLAGYMSTHTGLVKLAIAALAILATTMIAVGVATKVVATAQAVAKAATAAWTAAQWLLNAALSANPIGIVVLAVAGLVAAFVLAWRNSQTFRDIVKGVWAQVQNIFGVAKTIVGGYIGAIIFQVQVVIGAIKGIISAANAAKNALAALFGMGKHVNNPVNVPALGSVGSGGVPTAPNAPYQAAGVYNFPGGLAWVGEMGPELVQLPAGANVYSAGQSAGAGRGGGARPISITVNGFVGSETQLASKMRDMLVTLGRQEPGLFGSAA